VPVWSNQVEIINQVQVSVGTRSEPFTARSGSSQTAIVNSAIAAGQCMA
jgi:hypothetical protein